MPRLWVGLLLAVAAQTACASQDEKPARPTDGETPAINRAKAAAGRVNDSVSINDGVREEPVIFGYLIGARFYPLLLLDARGFDSEHAARTRLTDRNVQALTNPAPVLQLALAGREARDLANPAHVMPLVAETTYVDPYVDDRPGKFGAVAPLSPGLVVFAYLGPEIGPVDFRSDTAVARSFYRSFSRDYWGRQFFDNVSLDGPLQAVADSSKVRPYGMTDADGDGNPELWLTYQLMYGEIGAMVWENTPQGWRMLGYHCFRCD